MKAYEKVMTKRGLDPEETIAQLKEYTVAINSNNKHFTGTGIRSTIHDWNNYIQGIYCISFYENDMPDDMENALAENVSKLFALVPKIEKYCKGVKLEILPKNKKLTLGELL